MAFNGSGVHNRVHDWTQDLTNTIPVTASRMDAEHDDISAALSNTICRDGQSTTSARIPFASGVSAAAGSTSAVAYAQTNDANTGMYFPATDQWGLVAGGMATLSSTTTKLTAAVAVDFTGAAAPAADDGTALGSTSQKWSDLFLASGAVVNFSGGDVTITHSANALALAGASSGYTFDALVSPASSDGAALGSGTVMWSDLFLASGAVINFNNGDVTVTHSSNTLAFGGASSGYTFDAGVTTTGALSGATAGGDVVASKAEMEIGSATDKLVSPGRQQHHPAHPKAYAVLSVPTTVVGYGVASASNPTTGVYNFNFDPAFTSASYGVCFTPFHTASNPVSVVVAGQSASQVTIQVRNAASGAPLALDAGGFLIAYGDQ